MCSTIDVCFMCINDKSCTDVHNNVLTLVEHILPEITIVKLDVNLRICSVCEETVYLFSKFKGSCVEKSLLLESIINEARTCKEKGENNLNMCSTIDVCFMCTNDKNCTDVNKDVLTLVEYILPEITIVKLDVNLRICSVCEETVCLFSKFKGLCVENSLLLETTIKEARSYKERGEKSATSSTNHHPVEKTNLNPETLPDEKDLENDDDNDDQNSEGISSTQELNGVNCTQDSETISEKDYPYACQGCDGVFKNKRTATRHMRSYIICTDEDSESYPCRFCDKVCKFKESLKHHLNKIHSNIKKYNCCICNAKYARKYLLRTHILKQHSTSELAVSTTLEQYLKNVKVKVKKKKLLPTAELQTIDEDKTETTINLDPKILLDEDLEDDDDDQSSEEETGETCSQNGETISKNVYPYSCQLCDNVFKTRVHILHHMSTHIIRRAALNETFPCEHCGKVLKHKDSLRRHMFIHTNKKDFKCHLCNAEFYRRPRLRDHILSMHNNTKKFHCTKCERKCKTNAALKQHMRKVHKVKCGRKEKLIVEGKKEKLIIEGKKEKQIIEGKKEKQIIEGKKEKQIIEEKKEKLIIEGKTETAVNFEPETVPVKKDLNNDKKELRGEIFMCSKCDSVFKYEVSLERHMKEHIKIKNYKCYICNFEFFHNYKLKQHILRRHTNSRKFHCTKCPKKFALNFCLNVHLKRFHKVQIVKKKTTKKDKKEDKKEDKQEKKFKCDKCPKTFTQKCSLEQHLPAHETPEINCPKCTRSFRQKSQLDQHLKIHEELPRTKKKKCAKCDRSISLKLHVKGHPKFKHEPKIRTPFDIVECPECERPYRRDYLKKHMKIHNGEKNYECSICNKLFSQKRQVAQHMGMYHAEKNFQCTTCNKFFKTEGLLKYHTENEHIVYTDFSHLPTLISEPQNNK